MKNGKTLIWWASNMNAFGQYTNGADIVNKIFEGNYEKIVDANTSDYDEIHYIAGGSGLTPMYVSENGNPENIHYVYTDHLGSILTLTDAAGNIEVEPKFIIIPYKYNIIRIKR